MKFNLYILTTLFVGNLFAQQPKGDRILAWQVDMAENMNYDSAYAYARSSCMESIHLFFPWSSLEPSSGNFDATFINNFLDIVNIYHPASGIKAELQIAPINTVAKEVPADLSSIPFDSPVMISRFKTMLDTVFAHIPALELTALNIGNESDIYMDTDASQYNAYKTFLDSIVPYAKQLYFNIHGADLKMGTTFTYDGLTSAAKSSLCQTVNNGLDIVATTYYPLNSDFTMRAPTSPATDFATLVATYPDTLQPIYFVECGYSSSEVCNSSEWQQAQFYREVFKAWDKHAKNIQYLTVFKTTDWSASEVDTFRVYYGINDTIFFEYLRALGVRTWEQNGTNKAAYDAIGCELNARNWCTVNCISTGINSPRSAEDIQLYPNPANNFITIKASKSIQAIEIYNELGKLVLSLKNSSSIDLQSLAPGVYYVSLKYSSGQVISKKFIKQE